MDKKRTVQRGGRKKKGRPRVRFSFGMLLLIFFLSFLACFILYMIAANFNSDFFSDEFDSSVGDVPQVTSAADEGVGEETSEPVPEQTGITNPVPASEKADASYLGGCCMITDSTLLRMGTDGGFDAANVFGSEQLGAASCNTVTIESSFGTETAYDIVKSKKPSVLYIMLGSDIAAASQDDMISAYTTLVTNLHSGMPAMKIYVMQLPPTVYDSGDVTNDKVNEYNKKLLAMSDAAGVYCIDINTALKGSSGSLDKKYWSYDTLSLSAEGYKVVCDYILTHVA